MKSIQLAALSAVCCLPNLNLTAAPVTVAGDAFVHVATRPAGPPLAALAADPLGRIYAGNNSDGPGLPLQVFRPGLYAGTPVAFLDFGPVCDDADGLVADSGSVYVADLNVGVRRIQFADGTASVFSGAAGKTLEGSPMVRRAADGHIFAGFGGMGDGPKRIEEFDDGGGFAQRHTTSTEVQSLTCDPVTGLLYYAPYGTEVRVFDPLTGGDSLLTTVHGMIDGGLTFDPLSRRLFVGTAAGGNQGRIYTIDVTNGAVALFATGLGGCTGLLREPSTGDLFYLEADGLYRLSSAEVARGFQPRTFIQTAIEFWWISDSNRIYQAQWSTELDTNTWFDFGPPVPGNGATNFLFDSTRGGAKRFYRVLEVP